MQEYRIGETMSDEDSLMHYGVKGMKWGQRRTRPDSSGVSKADSRAARKENNKATGRKLEDWNDSFAGRGKEGRQARNDEIKKARKDMKQVDRDYRDTRDAIKAQKKAGTLGKNAAKVALNKAANQQFETAYKAQQYTSGEAALRLVMGVAEVALR